MNSSGIAFYRSDVGADTDLRSKSSGVTAVRSIALISSKAATLVNFRGALIEELVSRGVRVYALAPDFEERIRHAVRGLGAEPIDISLDRTGMRPLRDAADFVRLARMVRRLAPDATLSYFIKPVIYGSLAAWVARVPRRYALVAGLGYLFAESGYDAGLRRRILRRLVVGLYRMAFLTCNCVFFQNGDDAAYLTKSMHRAARKIVIVNGSGVDLRSWRPAEPVVSPVTFIMAARLLREKGVCEYVEAARLIRARYSNVRFILLGDLDLNPGALRRSDVEAWVAAGVVEWPGHVEDVRPWLRQASVFVLPSYREGVPRSTQEAMALGRPVITTDVAGCRETVQDGVNGFLVPARNIGALSEAMARFVETPSLIERMGKASRRMAEERFDVERINKQMLQAMGIV